MICKGYSAYVQYLCSQARFSTSKWARIYFNDSNDFCVVIQMNLSIHFLKTFSKVVREILSKSCEFREEMLFPKDKHFVSDKVSDIRIDRSLMVPNSESTEDMWRFWKNLCHEMFETSGQHEA
jgi:hypothetical protein